MDHLAIKEILQLTINAIDNETLWEKHYENLREIEKDLPESVKDDKDNENAEMPDSLDKLKISDFLKLELKVYGDEHVSEVEVLINNIEKKIFIPGVFNFRERLKLTLCAACHINVNVPFLSDKVSGEFSYDKLVEKFKTLDNLEMKHNTEEVSVSNANHDDKENQEKQIDFLLDLDAKFEENYEKEKKSYEKIKTGLKNRHMANSDAKSRKRGGSAANKELQFSNKYDEWWKSQLNSLDIRDIYKSIFKPDSSKLDLIDSIKSHYNTLNDDVNNEELREKMYKSFARIGFVGFKRGPHQDVLNFLNNNLKDFIKNKYSLVLNETNIKDLMKSVENQLKNWTFNKYSDYLKPFYSINPSEVVDPTKTKIIPKTKDDFDNLYKYDADKDIGNPISIFVQDLHSETIFKIYILNLFQYLCATTLKDIIQGALEKEKQDIGKMSRHTVRVRDIYKYYDSLKDANNPLLRAFLLFVRDCVHAMSNEIPNESKDEFWDRLEDSLGNHISLEDETIKCDGSNSDTTSLFDYIYQQLEKKGIDEKNIEFLVNKAQLIYLLQNYKCF